MPHFRSDLRTSAEGVITASARFSAFERRLAFVRDVDEFDFNYFVLRTPTQSHEYVARDEAHRETELRVHLRRLGGDELEDDLDDDSEAIEIAIIPLLDSVGEEYRIGPTLIDVVAAGERREGRLDMSFFVTRYLDEDYL